MGYSVRLQGVKPLKVQKRSGSRAARRVALVYGAQIGTYRPADAGIVRQRLLNNLSHQHRGHGGAVQFVGQVIAKDRKSTRLNSSHVAISYAVFCLKKKKTEHSTWSN